MVTNCVVCRLKEGHADYKCVDPRKECLSEWTRSLSKKVPHALVIACSDSRVPVEMLFNSLPGEIFVLRVAGNLAGLPVGGIIGSVEYAMTNLGITDILVLGHTDCDQCHKVLVDPTADGHGEVLHTLHSAQVHHNSTDLIESNVWLTIENLTRKSPIIYEGCKAGKIRLLGAIYDLAKDKVKFLGDRSGTLAPFLPTRPWRLPGDLQASPEEALAMLMAGNRRYMNPNISIEKEVWQERIQSLSDNGQSPLACVLACADSRVPVEEVFDMSAGDIFTLRVAGNVFEKGFAGSLDFAVDRFKTPVIVVMGHSQCGAVKGALNCAIEGTDVPGPLGELLSKIIPVCNEFKDLDLDENEKVAKIVAKNVFRTIETLLEASSLLRSQVSCGALQIHGAVYDLADGEVQFLGQHPQQAELIDLAQPTFRAWKEDKYILGSGTKQFSGVMEDLKQGNSRYAAGKLEYYVNGPGVHARIMQAPKPKAIVIGCGDSRVAPDTIFDQPVGDLYTVRIAGNICGHPDAGVIRSVEHALRSLEVRTIVVLGHTDCGVIDATVGLLRGEFSTSSDMLNVLKKVGPAAFRGIRDGSTEEEISAMATELNIWNTVEELIKHSSIIKEMVDRGELEIQGIKYDITSGMATFLGEHPMINEDLVHAQDVLLEGPSTMSKVLKDSAARSAKKHTSVLQKAHSNTRSHQWKSKHAGTKLCSLSNLDSDRQYTPTATEATQSQRTSPCGTPSRCNSLEG